MSVITITSENFQKEVLESDRPVLLDFWADWCGPCRMLSPTVDQIAEETPGLKVGKVDVSNEMSLAQQFQVANIPTLLYFKEGKLVGRTVGLQSKASIKNEFGIQ